MLTKQVSVYLDKVTDLRNQSLSRCHKNLMHAYFAGTDKFVGMKIGEAAKAACFDFDSPKLDFLRQAILGLCAK